MVTVAGENQPKTSKVLATADAWLEFQSMLGREGRHAECQWRCSNKPLKPWNTQSDW